MTKTMFKRFIYLLPLVTVSLVARVIFMTHNTGCIHRQTNTENNISAHRAIAGAQVLSSHNTFNEVHFHSSTTACSPNWEEVALCNGS